MSAKPHPRLWTLGTVLSTGVAIFSYRYLVGIGPLPPQILGNLFARPWLLIHIAGAATALLVGPFNFLPTIRQNAPQVHRWLGRIYIVACLVGGAGGLVSAFGSFAGPVATAGFGSLALCWLIANGQGWLTARAGRFNDHRAWMIRSFAMTFGAVTLRIYLGAIPLFHLDFTQAYRAISFLAWVPNLIVAEIHLRGGFKARPGGRQTSHHGIGAARLRP